MSDTNSQSKFNLNEQHTPIPNDLKKYISSAQKESTKAKTLEEQEHYERHQSNINNRNAIINTWNNTQTMNIQLRDKYATIILWFLGIQLLLANLIVILVGAGLLNLSSDLIYTTIIKSFLELVGFVYIIVNYLFKPIDSEMDKLLDKLDK